MLARAVLCCVALYAYVGADRLRCVLCYSSGCVLLPVRSLVQVLYECCVIEPRQRSACKPVSQQSSVKFQCHDMCVHPSTNNMPTILQLKGGKGEAA